MRLDEKLDIIRKNNTDVYKAGYEPNKQYDVFWDAFQNNGNRVVYESSYSYGWNDVIFNPKYLMQPTRAKSMFQSSDIETSAYTDKLDFSKCTNMGSCFKSSKLLKKLKKIDARAVTSPGGMEQMFLECYHLISIDEFYPSTKVNFMNTFLRCDSLREIRFKSVVQTNGLDMSSCKYLSKESITSVINALHRYVNGLTVTFSKEAVQNAFGIPDITDENSWTYEYKLLRNSKPNWSIGYI